MIGLSVNKHLFGATIKIVTSGSGEIRVAGFSKKNADLVKQYCNKYIAKNTQRSTTEVLADAIATAVSNVNKQ